MPITVDVPQGYAAQIVAAGQDPSRTALEALALEGYRSERLSESGVRRMLGYETRMEVHAFLKEHDVPLHFSLADLEQDRETMKRLLGDVPIRRAG